MTTFVQQLAGYLPDEYHHSLILYSLSSFFVFLNIFGLNKLCNRDSSTSYSTTRYSFMYIWWYIVAIHTWTASRYSFNDLTWYYLQSIPLGYSIYLIFSYISISKLWNNYPLSILFFPVATIVGWWSFLYEYPTVFAVWYLIYEISLYIPSFLTILNRFLFRQPNDPPIIFSDSEENEENNENEIPKDI